MTGTAISAAAEDQVEEVVKGALDVDWSKIPEALASVHYDGWVSVEVFDYDPGVEALASESIAYLQRLLNEIG